MKVKFCGITNYEDAKNAIDLGVEYLGFIVDFPKSPRNLSIEKFIVLAVEIKDKFPETKIVAVTVDMNEENIRKLIDSRMVDVLQFHGSESPEYCKRYKDEIEIWKSFMPVRTDIEDNRNQDKDSIRLYKGSVDRFNIDASSAKDKGKGIYREFSSFDHFRKLQKEGYDLILAGGLNPNNIKDFIVKLNPDFIDVASGIEEAPGKKSLNKMKKFMNHIKKDSKLKIEIRYSEISDAKRFTEILNNPNYVFFAFDSISLGQERAWLKQSKKQRKNNFSHNFAIIVNDRVVGGVGVKINQHYPHEGEIGYFIDESYWGGGVATEAVKKMETYAFKKLGLKRIVIVMDKNHKASEKVAIKAGYKKEGIMEKFIFRRGKYYDACLYAKVKIK